MSFTVHSLLHTLECSHTKHVFIMAPKEHQIDDIVGQEDKEAAPALSAREPAYLDM